MLPVYVNVYNRLTTTQRLCHQLTERGTVVTIVDNASDYGPLIDWLRDCPYDVVWLRENLGHHAPWRSGVIRQDAAPIYGVTDCDLDLDGVPADLFERMQEPFAWPDRVPIKSGVSLRIDDLPPWQSAVRNWEARFWKRPIREAWYCAAIDTTLALYQQHTPEKTCCTVVGVHAVRAAPPYCARHVPWYLDGDNLDPENQHYYQTASPSASWRPRGRSMVAPYLGGS